MSPQLIQKMAQIDSQVEFELTTASKVSGLLKEIGSEHVLLDTTNGPITILVDSIISVQSLVNVDTSESTSNTPNLDNQIDTSNPSNSKPSKIEGPDSANKSPGEAEASGASDIDTALMNSISEQNETPDVVETDAESVNSILEQDGTSDTADTNTQLKDSDPEQITTSETAGANRESAGPVNLEEQASRKLSEIVNRFNTEIGVSTLELNSPVLTFPALAKEVPDWQSTDISSRWVQIKNKYENARKIGELSAKFGRVQPIVSDLKSLTERFPESIVLKRGLAYFYSILGDWNEALQNYQSSAIQSGETNHWFDVAVSALQLDNEELACYSLQKYFCRKSVISITSEPKAWYTYVKFLEKFNNLSGFRELCKTDEFSITKEGIEVLLDTAIYLLQKKNNAKVAIGIIQKRMTGESTKFLLKEAGQELSSQPIESYRRFLIEFMNFITVLQKKNRPITSQRYYSNTVKDPTLRTMPQKQVAQTQFALNGKTLYKEAEQANQDGNLELAECLYQECIRQSIRHNSAVKNLAMVLVRLERASEAAEILEDNRQKVEDQQSLDNMLVTVYQHAGWHKKAIVLLNNFLKQTQDNEKKSLIHSQIANAYIKLEDYTEAENQFRQALKLCPDNRTVLWNLALCLSNQKRYDEAEDVLGRIQHTSSYSEIAAVELLDAIQRAKRTGEFIRDDNSLIEVGFSDFSSELSEFAKFFLELCKFEGIRAEWVNEGKYAGSEEDVKIDIKALEDIAKRLGTKRPHDRSNYYLSAARIYVGDNQDLFYRYLCRSFASRGNAAVSENRSLDTVREWYCEALTVYDGDRSRSKGQEQDAVNSLVRYLYSTLGRVHIDLAPKIPSVDKALRDAVNNHQDKKKVFDAVAYLVLHSQYAAEKILNPLFYNQGLRTEALNYLKGMKVTIPDTMERFNHFAQLWNELRYKKFNTARALSNELRLLKNFDFSTTWLEDNIEIAENIRSKLFFELDQQRMGELQGILKTALELGKQVTFEERERLCFQLRSFCQDLLRDIEESPTRVSVKDLYPITEVIQKKVNSYLNELYEASKPQLTLRLPVESYVPDTDRQIEVQIVLENERGRSPAESLELIVQEDDVFFRVTDLNIKQNKSLRGGEQSILTVPLRVTPDALQSQTFSLSLCTQYRTRTEEQLQTPIQDISIRLYSEDEFEKIKNPYAAYAEGGIVGDTNMFFGREDLIQNIARAIRESRKQSKSVMVFGQKRSGKSSVLYHLRQSLQEDKELLILDLGNMSTLLDRHARTSLLHQFLNGILRELERAIRRKHRDNFSHLELLIPSRKFYDHPAPMQLFEDIFRNLKDLTDDQKGQEDWRGVRIVLLIDEFQYIYEPIIKGEIPSSFMQNWKALLQANYFSAVLVGQDVMPKFKLRFPNEFGTTQDERVTYLKEEDARRLIDEPIRIGGRQGGSRYREQAIERILGLTGGSPFYIQIICNRLVDYMNVKHAGLVTEADVEQVKNELIQDVNALGLDKFDNLINSGDTSPDAISDEDALKVLKTIADNSNRTDPCHRDKIDCQTNSPIDTILDDLGKRDVVKRSDRSYQIQVGLFKEWLVVNG